MKRMYQIHAIERFFERGIGIKDVRGALTEGETIENYQDAGAYSGRLILAWRGKRPLHIVAVDNPADDEIIVVTGYRPDPARWTENFKKRRDDMLDV